MRQLRSLGKTKRLIKEGSFECNRCGACCRWPGYVRLEDGEVERISEFLGISVGQFTEKYTEVTDDRKNLSIIEREDGACYFLTDDGCAINSVKPNQCRAFPYQWNFFGWRKKCEMSRRSN
jgi:Fe-S-cluster containining protein